MIVTKIQQQKKDPEKYNIYIDGEYAFALIMRDILYFKIKENMPIEEDKYNFIISIILGEYVAYKLMKRDDESTVLTESLSVIILIFLFMCFVIFTYLPPEVNLFRDVTTGVYGIGNIR